MSEGSKRSRRRRGRGGGHGRQQPAPERQQQQAARAEQPESNGRPPRRDTRRGRRPEAAGEQPAPRGRIQRSPATTERTERRETSRGGRDGRANGAQRRDRTARAEPVPQDPRSVELGAQFREAHVALRDARKALDKRKAEFGDEPEWMLDQYRAAEARFEQVATEWSEHLAKTGRKIARR